MAVYSSLAVIGAHGADDFGSNSGNFCYTLILSFLYHLFFFLGSVYVFRTTNSGFSWSQAVKILASDGSNDNQFGFSVTLFNNIVGVGSPFSSSSTGSIIIKFLCFYYS